MSPWAGPGHLMWPGQRWSAVLPAIDDKGGRPVEGRVHRYAGQLVAGHGDQAPEVPSAWSRGGLVRCFAERRPFQMLALTVVARRLFLGGNPVLLGRGSSPSSGGLLLRAGGRCHVWQQARQAAGE